VTDGLETAAVHSTPQAAELLAHAKRELLLEREGHARPPLSPDAAAGLAPAPDEAAAQRQAAAYSPEFVRRRLAVFAGLLLGWAFLGLALALGLPVAPPPVGVAAPSKHLKSISAN
jgi:hypothetical protein